jgi:hypothetical protein
MVKYQSILTWFSINIMAAKDALNEEIGKQEPKHQ